MIPQLTVHILAYAWKEILCSIKNPNTLASHSFWPMEHFFKRKSRHGGGKHKTTSRLLSSHSFHGLCQNLQIPSVRRPKGEVGGSVWTLPVWRKPGFLLSPGAINPFHHISCMKLHQCPSRGDQATDTNTACAVIAGGFCQPNTRYLFRFT